MTVYTGDNAGRSGEFECLQCHAQFLITEGQKLPRCPECGNNAFRWSRELAGRMIFPPNPSPRARPHDLR